MIKLDKIKQTNLNRTSKQKEPKQKLKKHIEMQRHTFPYIETHKHTKPETKIYTQGACKVKNNQEVKI